MADSRSISIPLEYHRDAVIVTKSSGNVANASGVATLDSDAGRTTYITGFDIHSSGATAASIKTVVVSGIKGGSLTYTYPVVAGATVTNTPLEIRFPAPLPASGVDVDIVVTLDALGAGNTNATVNAYGFKL